MSKIKSQIPKSLTVPIKELNRLAGILTGALDAATEFGIEHASRERLLMLNGELTMALRLVRNELPMPPFRLMRRHIRARRAHRR